MTTDDRQVTRGRKEIPANERLIVPLDVGSFDEARALVEELGSAVNFYKIGLQLLLAGGGFTGEYTSFVTWLVERQKKVMVDIKIFDIPRTVEAAVKQLRGRGATFVTVHGTDEILRAAVAEKNDVQVLAVTVLTSFDRQDVRDLGLDVDIKTLVTSRAKRALALGCDGVISSGLEAKELRDELGERFLIVVPGVRPGWNREEPWDRDDQKRVVALSQAFENGADYVVVGRPIRQAENPRRSAEEIQAQIAAFAEQRPPS